MSRRSLLIVAYTVVSLGCTETEQPCAWYGDRAKVQGTRADYTTEPGDYGGYSLTGPTPCYAKSELVSVRGSGTRQLEFPVDSGCADVPESGAGGNGVACLVANTWAFDYSVKSALRAASIDVHDESMCTGRGNGILIDDWTRSNETVAIVAQEIVRWDLAATFGVEIGPVTYSCY